MSGIEAPVLLTGKPTGQTMTITRVDSLHIRGVVKFNGQPAGIYNSTISADGKSATNVGTLPMPGSKTQTVIETWVRL
jgi:sensor domain CHASE-containing protein